MATNPQSPRYPRGSATQAHNQATGGSATPARTQMKLHQQLSLASPARAKLKAKLFPRTTHGGVESKNKRKTARPFAAKAPMHIVLKSKRAKGTWSLLHRKHRSKITSMIYVYSARFKVHVYRAATVGNHIHLLVRAQDRKPLADFLRVLAGRIAVTVTGARKHQKRIGKFWDTLCWSRLVSFGRDFYHTRSYVLANELEEFSKEHRERMREAAQEMARKFGMDLGFG